MHYTAGLILSIVFKVAHVVETSNPVQIENSEIQYIQTGIHQLYTQRRICSKTNDQLVYRRIKSPDRTSFFQILSHVHYRVKFAEISKGKLQKIRNTLLNKLTQGLVYPAHYLQHLKDA